MRMTGPGLAARTHEHVVVGGGPAGAALAALLARAGREVLVLERDPEPRDKLCGENLSGEAQQSLRQIGLDPSALGGHLVRRTRLYGRRLEASADLPFDGAGLATVSQGDETLYALPVGAGTVNISIVSMGNPHAVQIVDDVDLAPVGSVGPLVEQHARFANKVNAGFMQIVDRSHIRLRVYERGAGETLACGTGSCAAVVAGIRRGLLDSPVRVSARGGELSVAWAGGDAPVFLSGPAVTVFEGEITV